MLTTPESNVKFTDEQKKQLEFFGGRLLNTQNEISIASGILTNLKSSVTALTKEKTYLEQQSEDLKKSVEELSLREITLKSSVEDSNTKLSQNEEKHKALISAQSSKDSDLVEREKVIAQKEIDIQKKIEELLKDKDKFSGEVKKFLEVKEILSNAIKLVSI